MSFASAFYLLLGFILSSAIAFTYLKFAPRIKHFLSRKYRVDLDIMVKLATCANSIGLQEDISGEKILIFTYKESSYAMRSDCSIAMEIAPNYWEKLSASAAINMINAMTPRKPSKPDNNQENKQNNNNQKQHNNNNGKQPDNGKPKQQNTISNDQAKLWYINRKQWDKRPNFALNNPYYLYQSNDVDTSGLWFVGKRDNGNKS